MKGALGVYEPSEWFLLTVWLSAKQFFAAVKANIISTNYLWNNTYRHYGELNLGEADFSWAMLTLAPIGLEHWSQNLDTRYAKQSCSTCQGCDAEECTTWKAARSHGG